MTKIKLDKENVLEVINLLKERYGNKKLSELQIKMVDDEEFMGITCIHSLLYGKLLSGKGIKIKLKSEGIKEVFQSGKKLQKKKKILFP